MKPGLCSPEGNMTGVPEVAGTTVVADTVEAVDINSYFLFLFYDYHFFIWSSKSN